MTPRGLALFLAMGLIWGIPYLLIKVAVRDVGPDVLVLLRTSIGAAILLPIAGARHQLMPVLRRWRPLVAYTAVELAAPWLLLSTAEKRLPSSLSGLLVAAVPMVGAALAWLIGDRGFLGTRQVAGLVVGLVGVAALVGFDVRGGDVLSVLMIGGVVVGYAMGPLILVKALSDLPGLGVVAASLGLCALVYAPFGVAHLPNAISGRALASIGALGVICTALAFVLFFHLITEIGALRATVITYVNPAVAVLLGVVFLHEGFGVSTAIGFVLILGGSMLATAPVGERRRPAPPIPIPEP